MHQMTNLDSLPRYLVQPYALDLTSEYFAPVNRQKFYASMQDFSVEYTILNREMPAYLIVGFESEISDTRLLKCLEFELSHDSYLKPFISTFWVTAKAPDTEECRQLDLNGQPAFVDFTITLSDYSQEVKSGFKLQFEYIQTPGRQKRLLFD